MPEDKIAVGAAGSSARRADIDQRGLCPGMAEQCLGGFKVLGVFFEIQGPAKVAELMRRHMDTERALNGFDDLNGDGLLVLPAALLGDK